MSKAKKASIDDFRAASFTRPRPTWCPRVPRVPAQSAEENGVANRDDLPCSAIVLKKHPVFAPCARRGSWGGGVTSRRTPACTFSIQMASSRRKDTGCRS